MQTLMYAYKFVESELKSINNIKLRTTELEEFHNRLKEGASIFCIDSGFMVDAMGATQGIIKDLSGIDRKHTRISMVEYDNPKIPEAAVVCLLDILSGLLFFRLKEKNEKFNYTRREVKLKKEKPGKVVYAGNDADIFAQLINQGFELLQNGRFVLSLLRFFNSYLRTDYRDIVLDCSSSIEALFNFSKELKLRYTLAAYHIDVLEPSYTSKMVKKLYDVRSKIIHGRTVEEINDNQFIGDILTANSNLLLSIVLRNHLFSDNEITEEILNHYKGFESE